MPSIVVLDTIHPDPQATETLATGETDEGAEGVDLQEEVIGEVWEEEGQEEYSDGEFLFVIKSKLNHRPL